MSEAGVPAKCPTCGTAIPEGAARCPGCGRVFGEDNRCPHCHAIAAVKPAGGGYVCLACGKPRERLPGTTVLGEPDARVSVVPGLASSSQTPREALGIAAIVLGGLALAAAIPLSGVALAIALATAAVGIGGGGAIIASARRRQRDRAARTLEQRVLALAKKRDGDLTVSEVAASLNVSTADADAALTRLSDGTRITAEIDESAGVLHFVFHELKPAVPKTRVEVEESEGEEASEVEKKGRVRARSE
jgi:hypothetical protein